MSNIKIAHGSSYKVEDKENIEVKSDIAVERSIQIEFKKIESVN